MVFLPRTGQGWVINVNGEDWRFDPFGRLLDRPDPDTYDPCWCGSKDSFRFCHRDKHKEPRVTMPEFLKGWEAAADLEMCLHPTAPAGCSVDIVKAHTVQRMGGGLRTIASEGQVYGYRMHPYFFKKKDLRLVRPERIGTRQASTFRGFCRAHDAALFKAVENAPFAASQEQLTLLNFRAIARRVFGMTIGVRHARVMLRYDRGLPPLVQREWFAVHHRELVNAEEALANITGLKAEYDPRVMAAQHADTNGFVVKLAGSPDFQCAEIVAIKFDFAGHRLTEPPPPAHLCAYTLAVDGGWAFVLSWLGRNDAAEHLCSTFTALPDYAKPAALLRYATEYADNIFFAPRWWDALPESQQTAMSKLLTDRLHPHYLNDPSALLSMSVPTLSGTYEFTRKIGPWAAAA